jgi:DHA1 family multidrug resistance protein-like MFS transporter
MTPSQRTFWSVWVANLVVGTGLMSFLPFFPSQIEAMGVHDPDQVATWTGCVFGVAPLMAALMGPIWGSLGDRVGRKPMVLRSLVAITLFVGAMGFARTPLELLLLRMLQGTFSGILPPSITLVSIGAPKGSQGRLAARLQMALAAGAIFGPLIGSRVVAEVGIEALFLGVGGSVAVTGILVLLFASEDQSAMRLGPERLRRGLLTEAFGDFRLLIQDRFLRLSMAMLFALQFGLGATNPLLELLVRRVAGGQWLSLEDRTALLFSAMAIVSVLLMPTWGRLGDRHGHYRCLRWCVWGSSLALLATSLVQNYEQLFGLRVALGLFSAGAGPLAYGVAGARTSAGQRGAANGAVFSAQAMASALSAMAGGLLARGLGLLGLFTAAALALFLAAALGEWGQRGAQGVEPRGE